MGDPDNPCSRCGEPLPARTAEGFCPKCLLKLGLEEGAGSGEESIGAPPTEGSTGPHVDPERIGPYRILQVLGEGGMGIVYLAEQVEPIRRRVALKVIKPGMDSRQVLARFESERQALAILNHPHIAKVFDAGVTQQGLPYFVMEHVSGVPITSYCDTRRLGLPERLELFMQACEAIQHAHQKGILHRDVKPSNVLVTEQDDNPMVKVIDFGVAKATSRKLTERTLFTQDGLLIGTPEYMSPEQAGTTGLEMDSRTDIYSLGVLLYELLVGALPFDPETLRRAAAREMLRIIQEDEPPKPTTRIGSLGDTAQEIATRRHTDLRSLVKQLRGDLEWITMRALEKDPARRYRSASELAADIRRHLEDEPVVAGPPSAAYRFKKLIRRRRAQLIPAGITGVAVLLGLSSFALFYRGAEARRDGELRHMIEQVVAGTSPTESTERSNRGELIEELHRRIRKDPGGSLHLFARRAAVGVTADIPSFGLLSDPPRLSFLLGNMAGWLLLPDDDESFPWSVAVEASWDGAPWRHVDSASEKGATLYRGSKSLEDIISPSKLTAGPHQLNLRARVAIYDPIPGSNSSPSDPESLSTLPPAFQEIRNLGSRPISLFEEFPADFPRQVPISGNTESARIAVQRLQIVAVRLPIGTGRCFSFPWPVDEKRKKPWDQMGETVGCVAKPEAPIRRLIAGLSLEGKLKGDPAAVPVAGRVTLIVPEMRESLAAFDYAFPMRSGGSVSPFFVGGSWFHEEDTFSIGDGSEQPFNLRLWLNHDGTEPLFFVPEGIPDGELEGALEFQPSRAVALATRRMERYAGQVFSLPVKITMSTVDGRWVEVPTSAHQPVGR